MRPKMRIRYLTYTEMWLLTMNWSKYYGDES